MDFEGFGSLAYMGTVSLGVDPLKIESKGSLLTFLMGYSAVTKYVFPLHLTVALFDSKQPFVRVRVQWRTFR
jgi:hypothetical protein